MTVYNDSFKMKVVQKMLLPNARPVSALAEETGLPEGTLYRWRKETIIGGMPTDRSDEKAPTAQPPHQWSAAEKVAVVLEAAGVAEAELGPFLRRKGLHAAQLAEWRKQVTEAGIAALQGGATKAARKSASAAAKRVRELERELRRKDKALAEAAALLILKKKAQAIWGDEDDDTDPRNEE